ncbi:MAG: hypothetical protein GY839_19125 [candidate division Zixibacteria bacterium]|nr:hypothetical protein [candidate division Zixibacteria bacterium]
MIKTKEFASAYTPPPAPIASFPATTQSEIAPIDPLLKNKPPPNWALLSIKIQLITAGSPSLAEKPPPTRA